MYAFREAHRRRDATKKLDERDEAGERVIAGRRASPRAIITEALLRQEVSSDLEVLMNTINLAAAIDLGELERVRHSILNFGFPDVAHRTIDEMTLDDIRHEFLTVLRDFEPRIAPDTIEIARDHAVTTDELKVRFMVRADLCCEPLNVPVEFVADLAVDTGKIVINRI